MTLFVFVPPPRVSALPTFELTDIPRITDAVATDGFLFLTADDAPAIAVLDENGAVVGALPTEGAPDLALEGDALWAVESGTGEAHRYDTGAGWPFSRTVFDVSPITHPGTLAVTAADVWIVGTDDGFNRFTLRLDAATGEVDQVGIDLEGTAFGTHPAHPDQIWVGDRYAQVIERWDVSDGTPSLEASVNDAFGMALRFGPDGSSIIVSRRGGVRLRDALTLELTGPAYTGTGQSPNAASFAPDGETLVIASPRIDHIVGGDLWVYDEATGDLRFRYRMPLEGFVDPYGTVFSADGDTLYVIQRGINDGPMHLTVLPGALEYADLDVAAPERARYGGRVRVDVSLGSAPTTTNTTVRLYAEPAGRPRELIATRDVSDDGAFTVSYGVTRSTTFVAEWDGDATYLPLFVSEKVRVPAVVAGSLKGFYATSGRYKLFRAGDRPVFVARVKPNHAGDLLTFELARSTSGRWRTLGRATVELSGSSVAGVRVRGLDAGSDYRMRAKFRGDNVSLPDTSSWAYFRLT